MRLFLCLALLLPAPVLAETLLATSTVTAVTVFPQGAQITRQVRLTAPPGAHEVLITDLPEATSPQLIRLAPQDGLQVGAFALRTDRLPPRDEALSAEQMAAKAEVERRDVAVQEVLAVLGGIDAQVAASEATAAFLQRVTAGGEGETVQSLRETAAMIGAEVLAARQAALTAGQARRGAEKALVKAQEGLAQAQAALEALAQGDKDYSALAVAVTVPASGAVALDVTHFVGEAYWQPVYDLSLTRNPAALTIARGVLVSQSSGEDWAGVALTLSTAQPSAQAEPSQLWPDLRRIGPEVQPAPTAKSMADERIIAGLVVEAMVEPAVVAQAALQGDVVVYQYPGAVDVASGVENLRLALDELAMVPVIEARAVPSRDATAFVLATFTNDSGEILLPGEAYLLREGTLVGSTYLEVIAPGDEAELAFGAIEAVRLTREQPVRSEGDRGILVTSRQSEESAVITVRNLGTESWPVRVLDQVPYSEQEDLEITYSAVPPPSEVDVEAQRGILGWRFDLAPGAEQVITLDHVMRWPDGMVIQ